MTARIDPRLGAFARTMRNAPTPTERKLWSRLKTSQLGGYKFRRQSVIGGYIADFSCSSVGLVVELDGMTHEPAYDARRDTVMGKLGYEVLHFSNHELGRNLEGVLVTILAAANRRPARWPDLPHPTAPSPEGEGES